MLKNIGNIILIAYDLFSQIFVIRTWLTSPHDNLTQFSMYFNKPLHVFKLG